MNIDLSCLRSCAVFIAFLCALTSVSFASEGNPIAPESAHTLVVANGSLLVNGKKESVLLAQEYMKEWKVPGTNFLELNLPNNQTWNADTMLYSDFVASLFNPVMGYIHTLRQKYNIRIDYIALIVVPTRLKIPAKSHSYLDFSLPDYLAMGQLPSNPSSFWTTSNPYYMVTTSFNSDRYRINGKSTFLVTNIVGWNIADVQSLIGHCLQPRIKTAPSLFLANKFGWPDAGWNSEIEQAAKMVKMAGLPEMDNFSKWQYLDTSGTPVQMAIEWGIHQTSWNEAYYNARVYASGALIVQGVSTNGMNMAYPNLKPTSGRIDGGNGPDQNQVARAILGGPDPSIDPASTGNGVSGGIGEANEPYVTGLPDPTVVVQNYVLGNRNAVDALYSAVPFLGWQTIVFGAVPCRFAGN